MRRVLLLLLAAGCVRLLATDTLVCLGDSLTAGFGVAPEEAFPARLQALIDADHLDWKVVNAGVSGDTTAAGLRRVDWVLKAKPKLVLVALGGNDGLRGQPTATMRGNLAKICERLQRAKAAVALAGMQLPPNYGADFRQAFADVFPAVAKDRGVPLMPFLLEGVGGMPELNQADGIHPTAAGQAEVAKHVYAFLKPLLAAAPAAVPAQAP
jgi:acyl-CoA thioesterase-1